MEQVTHIFSSETGFVTVITPDLVVSCNEIASMTMVDALLTYFTGTWLGYHTPKFNSGKVGAVDLGDLPWSSTPFRGAERSSGSSGSAGSGRNWTGISDSG